MQQNSNSNLTDFKQFLSPFSQEEKERTKIQRRILKENIQQSKVSKHSIRLNLRKLPRDWFTPRKSVQKSTSRQSIQTQRYIDTLPSTNPQSQYSSERLIGSNQFQDELQRTSNFGQSIQSPSMKKKQADCQSIEENQNQAHDVTIQFELSKQFNDSNDHLVINHHSQHQIDSRDCLTSDRSTHFDITFSSPYPKGKSFSVKKIYHKIHQPKSQQISSQFHIDPEKNKFFRNISHQKMPLSKEKEIPYNKTRRRLLSREGKNQLTPFSLQNTQQIQKRPQRFYFRKQEPTPQMQQVFQKLNDLCLPPISKCKKN